MNNIYQTDAVNTKIKLAGLWTAVMFCYIYGDYFELYVPGKVAGLLDGNNLLNSPGKLFAASGMMVIPILMIPVSLILKHRISKVLNVIFGILFTAIMLLIAVSSLERWRIFYVFLAGVESVLTLLIVWLSVKWRDPST